MIESCIEHYALIFEGLLKKVSRENGKVVPPCASTDKYRKIIELYEAAMNEESSQHKTKQQKEFDNYMEEISKNLYKVLVENNTTVQCPELKEYLQQNTPIHSIHILNWVLQKAEEDILKK